MAAGGKKSDDDGVTLPPRAAGDGKGPSSYCRTSQRVWVYDAHACAHARRRQLPRHRGRLRGGALCRCAATVPAALTAYLTRPAARLAGSDYRLSRDDPTIIRRRCLLVTLVCAGFAPRAAFALLRSPRAPRSALWLGCLCGSPFRKTLRTDSPRG